MTHRTPFHLGQRVEVLRTDFTDPQMRALWMPATILDLVEVGSLTDVGFRVDGTRYNQVERTGPRGGGKVRAVKA